MEKEKETDEKERQKPQLFCFLLPLGASRQFDCCFPHITKGHAASMCTKPKNSIEPAPTPLTFLICS